MHVMEAVYADTPHTGGLVWVPAADIAVLSTTTVPALTRTAQGDYCLKRTAGGAETITFAAFITQGSLSRLLESENFQEQFGGTLGPAPVAGFPPFTGASQLTSRTTAVPKGIKITDVVLSWKNTIADATSLALTLDKVAYANGVANGVTNIPLTATVLPVTLAATPRLIATPVTTPSFNNTENSTIVAELTAVLQNLEVFEFHGIGFHVTFNYN